MPDDSRQDASRNSDLSTPDAPQQVYRQHRFQVPKGGCDMLLIRHGESEPARAGVPFALKDGHGDPALHPDGVAQAQAVADRLGREHFDAIYVTTLRRTQQTAAPLAARLGLVPRVEPDLREVHLGDWDNGLYRIRAAQNDPAFLRARDGHEWGEIPGAETTKMLQTRVRAALIGIAAAHPGQRLAVFVHGGVIGAAMAVASGARGFVFNGAANGSISRLVILGDQMMIQGFNDCAHLPD
jgi:probable phosphoglycerate mutase